MSSDVNARVVKIVAEQLSVKEEEVISEASFNEDLGADSLDIIEIVMSLEKEFEIDIEDEEVENISTVKEAVDCIESHIKE